MSASFGTEGTYAPDNLLGGEFPRVVRNVTLTGAAALTRGAVLGRISASSKFTLSAAAAGDGSEVPEAVLVEDADPSGGDVSALAYLSGEFNESALSVGAGHDADSVRQDLREHAIFTIAVQGA